ncbi:MAG: hypothetical protein ACPLPR_02115 [Bacillota bacterium]
MSSSLSSLLVKAPFWVSLLASSAVTVTASVAVLLHTGIHTFDARLKKQDGAGLFKVTMVRDVRVTQRRKCVRVQVQLPVVYRTTTGEAGMGTKELAEVLSWGGMRLVSEEKPKWDAASQSGS